MKKRRPIAITLLLLLYILPVGTLTAQIGTNSKARVLGEAYFEQKKLEKALAMFNKHEQKKNALLDEEFLQMKAETYFKLGRFDEAVNCYARALEIEDPVMDTVFFKGLLSRSSNPLLYSEILETEETIETDSIYAKDLFAVNAIHAINSEYSEFAPIEHNGITYFTTNRLDAKKRNRDINTGNSFYDIYQVNSNEIANAYIYTNEEFVNLNEKQKDELKEEQKRILFKPTKWLNTKYNDGPISFLGDTTLFATRNEPTETLENGQRVFHLNIYEGNTTKTEVRKSFFSQYFEGLTVGHISFSPDGKQACMSAKANGRKADLFFSRLENDQWTTPINAGNLINGDADELFPFWSNDGFLFFSSDSRIGYGGLDIYKVDPSIVGDIPVNIGPQINSAYDDFSFSIDKDGKGYLASNRPGGQGSDDIYQLELKRGTIHVILDCDPSWALDPWFKMEGENIDIFENFNIAKERKVTYKNLPYGDYKLNHLLPTDSVYAHVPLYSPEETVYIRFKDPIDTLIVRFSNFRFDEHSLSEINQENFQKLVTFLEKNPDIKVKIKGHTDQFGTISYNDKLGMRRCNAMEKFLLNRGIVNPIEKISFGRSQLVSKTEHRLNRRVDVELTEPKTNKRLTFVPRGEREQKVNLQLTYDDPKKFDDPLEEGYYIKFKTSSRYQSPYKISAAMNFPRNIKTLIFSEDNYVFKYYVRVPFKTKDEAQQFAKELNIKQYTIEKLKE